MLFLDAWREEKTIHTEIIFSSIEVMMVFGVGWVCVERHELETAQNQSPYYAYNSFYCASTIDVISVQFNVHNELFIIEIHYLSQWA